MITLRDTANLHFSEADVTSLRKGASSFGDWRMSFKPAALPGQLKLNSNGTPSPDGELQLTISSFEGYVRFVRELPSSEEVIRGLQIELGLRVSIAPGGRHKPVSLWGALAEEGPEGRLVPLKTFSHYLPSQTDTVHLNNSLILPDQRTRRLFVIIQFRARYATIHISHTTLSLATQAQDTELRWEAPEAALPMDKPAPALLPTAISSPPDAPVTGTAEADVIVCVHNALEDVVACLRSVNNDTERPRRVIIVNDGSNKSTTDFLESYANGHPNVTYVRNKMARGYTLAANQGLKLTSSDYVVLLNSDTIVSAGWLHRMIACAQSHPDAGIVGPLSNAASWQSIPMLRDKSGGWCVNTLPQGVSLETYAQAVATRGAPLYPRVWLVNGFCYLITRTLIEAIGLLDGKRFPTGYGEEDDFSLRAQNKGFSCYIADDVYVYHAKSKSFTPAGRLAIVGGAKGKLAEKHGKEIISLALSETSQSEELLKARVHSSLVAGDLGANKHADTQPFQGLRVAWIQPHLGLAGAIRRTIEMTNRMAAWGASPVIVTKDGQRTDWLPIAAEVVPFEALPKLTNLDALIFSDPDVVDQLPAARARVIINYHLAAYMAYRSPSAALEAYYRHGDGIVHFANSRWTAEQIQAHAPSIHVNAIFPGGIDRMQFRPSPEQKQFDIGAYGTLRRLHKGTMTVMQASTGYRRMLLATLNAPQEDLHRWIGRSRVFVSGAWHEGFNFCPLEAMACGTPVVMTDDGGSRDYAVPEWNALVVEPKDSVAMRAAIDRLMTDQALRLKLIENGLQTAWRYNWDDITRDFMNAILKHLPSGGRTTDMEPQA